MCVQAGARVVIEGPATAFDSQLNGGALFLQGVKAVTLDSVSISNNVLQLAGDSKGGGVFLEQCRSVVITGVTLEGTGNNPAPASGLTAVQSSAGVQSWVVFNSECVILRSLSRCVQLEGPMAAHSRTMVHFQCGGCVLALAQCTASFFKSVHVSRLPFP